MNCAGRTTWRTPLLAAAGMLLLGGDVPKASAQWSGADEPFELSDAVQIDRADSSALAQLGRVEAYVADRQWDEAIETLRELMENSQGKLVGVTERRYISLRDYGHLQLAMLPGEALELYRSRVDPLAKKWYEEGVRRRDRRLLTNVIEQAFVSSWGDDALMALGEMALESGRYSAARWHFERIVPAELPPDVPRTWPGYPDTDLDLAAVRGRLVLVSILEGSADRARDELSQFARLHGDARGRLGGREVNYAEALRGLLSESLAWPRPQPNPDWPTFAGSPLRNKIARKMIDTAGVAWRVPIGESTLAADDAQAPLSYHPILVGEVLLVGNRREILAVDVQRGKPVWSETGAVIYRAPLEGIAGVPSDPVDALGLPRCTMTVHNGKLYARMGTTVTSRPQETVRTFRPGYIVALDLAAEGRLMWKITPEEGWALEGSPLADGTSVYVAMRRSGARPEAHVACFDAQTGSRRWRRFICSAEMPATLIFHQSTHNLLSMRHETLYYNTNLGAVAALSRGDGQIEWLSLYPRALRGRLSKLEGHWRRDLNPCLIDGGTLLVAPADSPRIFAFDAATGLILWKTGPEIQDVLHLLGATDEHLIASGDKLYWIGLQDEAAGRVKHVWPEGPEKPGYGRGVLAADSVLWPTREKIYVFDQKTAQPRKVIDLAPHGITGGNLLIAGGRLLIATPSELIAMRRYAGRPENNTHEVTAVDPRLPRKASTHWVSTRNVETTHPTSTPSTNRP